MSAGVRRRMADLACRTLLSGPHRYWLLAILLVTVTHYAWGAITRPWGDQKVSFVPADQVCATDGPLRYCINRDKRGTNGDIVYHLHGRNLEEQIWNDDTYFTAMVQQQWQQGKALPPVVVTLSYGKTWLLTPKGAKPDSGLLDDMMARLPAIEAKIGAPRRRLLLGESMGGLNVLVAGLSHPSKFAKIAALCPGVYAFSPFGPQANIQAAIARTGADPKIAMGVWLMANQYLANEGEWQRISPLSLIERAGPKYPALYLSNGLYDAYGNYEGTERLAELALRRGIETEWHPIYGGHCATDTSSLAAFLLS